MTLAACKRPCANCPWRRDARPGEFATERYQLLAASAQDMSVVIFTCHKSPDGGELACAGFLARGADHNFAVRMAYYRGDLERRERDGGEDLYDDYREMAEANGVEPGDPSLRGCR